VRRQRRRDAGARKVLYAGLAGNALVAAAKFGAAAVTSSAAMLSEAVHSLVDTSNELLLLYGERRSELPPDKHHPFGHGREVYFWSFMVSVLVFVIGAGVSIAEGVRHVLDAEEIENPVVSYVVLGFAAVFEGGSWWVAWREFRKRKGDRGVLQTAQETKDPSTVMVFFEDSAALIGIAIAFAGTALAQALDEPRYDGAASIAIGVLLAVVAVFLARENKQLLIGEGARRGLVEAIGRLASAEKGVAHFNGLLTIHLAPREVVVALSLDFDENLRASEVNDVVARLDARIRKAHPEIVMAMMKPQSPDEHRKARDAWFAPRGES
jgi:cation diffusion facilitator family transporter